LLRHLLYCVQVVDEVISKCEVAVVMVGVVEVMVGIAVVMVDIVAVGLVAVQAVLLSGLVAGDRTKQHMPLLVETQQHSSLAARLICRSSRATCSMALHMPSRVGMLTMVVVLHTYKLSRSMVDMYSRGMAHRRLPVITREATHSSRMVALSMIVVAVEEVEVGGVGEVEEGGATTGDSWPLLLTELLVL